MHPERATSYGLPVYKMADVRSFNFLSSFCLHYCSSLERAQALCDPWVLSLLAGAAPRHTVHT
jgi:hypothetical protein